MSGHLEGELVFRQWTNEMPESGELVEFMGGVYVVVTQRNVPREGGRRVCHALYVPPDRVPREDEVIPR